MKLKSELNRIYCLYKSERRRNQTLTRQVAEKTQFAPSKSQADNVMKCMASYIENPGLDLSVAQVRNAGKAPSARRYSVCTKVLFLGLNYASPLAYRFVSQLFTLPSVTTLNTLTSTVKVEPGLCPAVIATLER